MSPRHSQNRFHFLQHDRLDKQQILSNKKRSSKLNMHCNYGLVSIIMPAYNSVKYVAATINSITDQTYPDWELLFQDDCSTDGTKSMVMRIAAKDPRIKYECNQVNSGAAVTRNNALKRANGKWIAFLDSDDLWCCDKLEKQLTFMTENGYLFSYTGYNEIDEKSIDLNRYIYGPKSINKLGMYCYCWPGCLTVMYDREHVGLIQIADIKKNNDYAMWLKVCRKVNCYLLDECLAKYRKGRSGSISTHGYFTLIKWHYKLFRDAEGMNNISAIFFTGVNLLCGIYKKSDT